MSNPSAPSTAIARDKFSGQPNSLGETALEMLAAGFLPEENPYLAAKLFNIAKSNLEGRVHGSKRFNIPIEQSASAMCVVDELGVLEVRSSTRSASGALLSERTGRRDLVLLLGANEGRVSATFY